MIKSIKKLVSKYVDTIISKIIKRQQSIHQEQFAFATISQLFNEARYIPFTTWTISPSTIQHVLNDIQINSRNCIVELGSGTSTLFIAKLLKIMESEATFVSIESDKVWAGKMEGFIKNMQLENHVKIIQVPLNEVPNKISHNKQAYWYDTILLDKAFMDIESIDLIIVDGPYAKSTAFARYSAIPYFRSKLYKNYSIYLDDIDRQEEKIIASLWENILNCKIRFYSRYAVLYSHSDYSTGPYRV